MLDTSTNGPITKIALGRNGRPWKTKAVFKKRHLKPRIPRHLKTKEQRRGTISARVKRFVNFLGRVKSDVKYAKKEKKIRESDECGHIAGDALSGPSDKTYNFFPQSPFCNAQYYDLVEKPIYDYLESSTDPDAYAELFVQMIYVNYFGGVSSDRPAKILVVIKYSDGRSETFFLSNM